MDREQAKGEEPEVIRREMHQAVERLRGQVREIKRFLEQSEFETPFRGDSDSLEREHA